MKLIPLIFASALGPFLPALPSTQQAGYPEPPSDIAARMADLPVCAPALKTVLSPTDRARRNGRDAEAAADAVRRMSQQFPQTKCEARVK